jgi:hypothetical protein
VLVNVHRALDREARIVMLLDDDPLLHDNVALTPLDDDAACRIRINVGVLLNDRQSAKVSKRYRS